MNIGNPWGGINNYAQPQYIPQINDAYNQMIQYNRALLSDNYWLNERLYEAYEFINRLSCKKELTPKEINCRRGSNEWYCKERNGRIVTIGTLKIKLCSIVNIHSDETYDALYCILEDDKGQHSVVIPYKKLIKRDILEYMVWFNRNIDCPDKYISAVFYEMLLQYKDPKYLTLPKRSGWHKNNDDILTFANKNIVDPYLDSYYNDAVKERKLLKTERALKDIAKDYSQELPSHWKFKLLVVLRVASLLLYFFNEKGIKPDQIFVIEPSSEKNAGTIISLTKTTNYETNTILSINNTKTEILNELNFINDGMVLFRDESLAENYKKLNANIELLCDDIRNIDGIEDKSRHLITVISSNPANISDNAPTMHISFNDIKNILSDEKNSILQKLSGEFDCELIQSIINDPKNNIKKVLDSINNSNQNATIVNSEYINTIKIIDSTAKLLEEYGIITGSDIGNIHRWYRTATEINLDTYALILDEFSNQINELIHDHTIKIARQNNFPYYNSRRNMIFETEDSINLDENIIKNLIPIRMKTTKKHDKILKALKKNNILICTKGNKRAIKIHLSEDETKTLDFYSLSKEFLDEKSLKMLRYAQNQDQLFPLNNIPNDNYVPLVCIDNEYVSGIQILPESDENFHTYVSGKTRFGKTFFLLQQALFHTNTDEHIIIFDNNGAFSYHELKKAFKEDTDEIIDKFISVHNITEQKIPVDLFSLENCGSEYLKKNRIISILTASDNKWGNIQTKVLDKKLSDLIKTIDKFSLLELSDDSYFDKIFTQLFSFFKDSAIKEYDVDDKLESTIIDIQNLKMIRQSWGDFLKKQNKIVIISTGEDSLKKGTAIIDMMLASLYAHKVKNIEPRYTIIIDEIKDQNLSNKGALNTILRKGGKYKLFLMMASQEFLYENLNEFVGNIGINVFFRPTNENVVAKYLNDIEYNKKMLSSLETGEMIIVGNVYNKAINSNLLTKVKGKTYEFRKSKYFTKPKTEIITDTNNKANPSDCKLNKNEVKTNHTKDSQDSSDNPIDILNRFKWVKKERK